MEMLEMAFGSVLTLAMQEHNDYLLASEKPEWNEGLWSNYYTRMDLVLGKVYHND